LTLSRDKITGKMDCYACLRPIGSSLEILKCATCLKTYHYMCLNLTSAFVRENKLDLIRSWQCPDCANVTMRRKHDNSLVRQSTYIPKLDDSTMSVEEHQNGPREDLQPQKLDMSTSSDTSIIINELRAFRHEVTTLFQSQDARLSAVQNSIKQLTQNQDILRTDVNNLLETVDSITVDHGSLRTSVEGNTKRLQELELKVQTTNTSKWSNPGSSQSLYNTVTLPNSDLAPSQPLKGPGQDNDDSQTTNTYAVKSTGRHSFVRARRPIIRATGDDVVTFKTVEPQRHIHAWNFHLETTEDNIKTYLNGKIPCDSYTVKRPEPTHTTHTCFIIGLPNQHLNFFMKPENWPKNIALQEWTVYRNTKPRHNVKNTGRTFFRTTAPKTPKTP
jgi:hypothetical protein